MLELKNISKIYKDGSVGVKNINLTLPDKGLIVIVGKSGSGKSTLLNLISGIMTSAEGEILYNGKNIKHIRNYKGYVGNVFQDYNLIRDLNVIDNINLISSDKTDELMSRLKISDLKKKKIDEISGGEARRVGIARSLNKNAKILLCDEPTESLDEFNEKEILEILKDISKDILVILVSHKDSVRDYADRIINVSKGEIIDDKIIKEDKTKVNETESISKVKLGKLIKISLFRIFHNIGLFSINLSSLFLVMSLLLIATVLKNTDLARIEVDEMSKHNSYKMNIVGYSLELNESKLKKVTDKYNKVYDYILSNTILDFKFDRANSDESIGAFYLSSINWPKVVKVNENTFIDDDEIVGSLPSKPNEVLISEYTFEGFKKFGVLTKSGEYKKYDNINSVIGEEIIFGNKEVVISGVLRQNLALYEKFKDVTFVDGYAQNNIFSMFESSIVEMNYAYVADGFDEYIEFRSKSLVKYYVNTKDTEILYDLKSSFNKEEFAAVGIYSEILGKFVNLVNKLKIIGSIILVIVFIFSSVVLFNYFSNSIENHEKDNKILKYLGVSNFGIFVPYLFSLLIIMVISFIGGLLVFNMVAKTLNEFYYSILSNRIDIFVLSAYSIIPVLLSFVGIILVLSLISIFKINKTIKKYTA